MFKYSVITAELNTTSTLLLTLQNTEPSRLFGFQPGQYVAISFLRHGRRTPERCFSLVSSPTDQEKLQVSMRIKGRFTKGLAEVKAGDPVWVRGPFGSFVFDGDRHNKVVLLAGGIGITPFMSMIHFATRLKLDNSITLLYSSQTQNDIPFLGEITKLHNQNPHFKPTFIIGDGDTSKLSALKTAPGRISPELIQSTIGNDINAAVFFICGPPPFMKAMKNTLLDKGVHPENVKTEAFSQGPAKQTGRLRSWPNNVYILTSVGFAVAAFLVTVSDIIKTLPPLKSFSGINSDDKADYSNLREDQLDELVNENSPTVSTTKTTPKTTTKTTTSSSSSTTSKSTKSTTTKKPAPKPAAPVCTTNASGITTCI